jgi:hypothetical protein
MPQCAHRGTLLATAMWAGYTCMQRSTAEHAGWNAPARWCSKTNCPEQGSLHRPACTDSVGLPPQGRQAHHLAHHCHGLRPSCWRDTPVCSVCLARLISTACGSLELPQTCAKVSSIRSLSVSTQRSAQPFHAVQVPHHLLAVAPTAGAADASSQQASWIAHRLGSAPSGSKRQCCLRRAP